MRGSIRSFAGVAIVVMVLSLSSCASLSPNGVGFVKRYSIANESLPPQFDGYKVAFVSDIHYPSLFNRRRLAKVIGRLRREAPDVLLLGGDYVTADSYIKELFDSLSAVSTVDGTFAVLGNHERRNKDMIAEQMACSGIKLLADSVAIIQRDSAAIYIAGIYDSFAYDSLVVQPAETIDEECFTILLCHTPDYAERSSTTADVVFSGHTHGGQVSLFGMYTPVKNSSYGKRFLRGRNVTSSGSTVITTNGLGTSRRKVRFCVPSEIVVARLVRVK